MGLTVIVSEVGKWDLENYQVPRQILIGVLIQLQIWLF